MRGEWCNFARAAAVDEREHCASRIEVAMTDGGDLRRSLTAWTAGGCGDDADEPKSQKKS